MLGNGISVVRQRCEKCKWPPAPAHIPGLCNTLPPQHHPNTPCITSHPSTAATGTTGATACGPVEQTHRVYPTAEVTGGERLGEQWEGNTEEIEGRGETGGGGWPLGLFAPYHLSHNPFATQRAEALPFHRIRASHLRKVWIELCSVCLGGLLYVKHKSVQFSTPSSAFCRCVPAHTFPSTQPKHLHWQQGSQSNNWHKPAP